MLDFKDLFYKQKGAKKPAAKKASTNDLHETGSYDWTDTKAKILEAIAKLVLLNIQKLWDPPIAEEQFVM